jgi:hypothetical protein
VTPLSRASTAEGLSIFPSRQTDKDTLASLGPSPIIIPSTAVPFNFTQVHDCKTKAIDEAFLTIFKDASIDSPAEFAAYTNCTTDERMTPGGGTPSDFTQSFCGSETHIVSLAHKYSQYLVWFPVALAILTFVLLVATICLIAAAQKERRRQIRLLRGEDPFNSRVQMAGP